MAKDIIMITRVRGTEDLLDLRIHNFIQEKIKLHLTLHNFIQIDTPILEQTDLFIHAIGTQTDIVSKEMYTLQTTGEESICLRPEATASIIRAYVENKIEQAPWKVFLIGPMFRHERPQKGRWRQFSQASIEIINTENIAQDAYFLKVLDGLFHDIFKLDHYALKLNFLGCSDDRANHKAALLDFLQKNQESICPTCIDRVWKNTLRVFDCKNEACKTLYRQAPTITDHLCTTCSSQWTILTQLLDMISVNYVIDPTLVRGLDYYNKTVFEFSSRELGAQDAFCGGGRYRLGKETGAQQDIPSIGVGIGMGRLALLVEKNANKYTLPQDPVLHAIIPVLPEQEPLALILGHELETHQLSSDILLEKASLSNLMKKANKMGAKYVLVIGPDEQQNGTVSIKHMQKGTTSVVKQAEVIQFLRS